MFKKIITSILIVTLAVNLCIFSGNAFSYADTVPKTAEAAMELTTGKTLHEKNAETRLPMASTTKIMTALIILEDCDLNAELAVPEEAAGVEGSSIYLKKGEIIDVRDLVYGLMLRSGNDSAAALAIYHSGSIEKFAEKMNARAKELGAENTNFTNPSGLPDKNHYTTARDLCLIAVNAMRNEVFRKIVSTKSYTGKFRSYENKNKMLKKYEGANGVKTGYTLQAGRCLVSSAERNGMDVVCAVLNCREMYERSAEILDGCFNDYSLVKIDKNSVFMSDKVLCKPAETVNLVVKNSENLDFKVTPVTKSKKIKVGDFVAKLEIFSQNDLIFSTDLYSIIDSKI